MDKWRERNTKRTGFVVLFLLFYFLIMLGGCSKFSGKNETEIFQDLKDGGYLPVSNLVMTDSEIILRQTNKDTKDDYVQFKLYANNSFVECVLFYDMYYDYYDKGGWVINRIQPLYKEWEISLIGEDTAINDLISYDSFMPSYNLIPDSIVVTSRSHSDDMTYEEIRLLASCKNEYMECESPYTLFYSLTDEGWMLTDYVKAESTIKPLMLPNGEDAKKDIQAFYSDCTLIGYTAKDDEHVGFRFKRQESYNYLARIYYVHLDYYFSVDGWTSAISEELSRVYPDIVGEWKYEDDDNSYYINVLSFDDLNDNEITLEYNFHKVEHGGSSFLPQTYTYDNKTSGPIKAKLRYNNDYYRFESYFLGSLPQEMLPMYFSVWLYVGDGLEPDNIGFRVDGYTLIKQ